MLRSAGESLEPVSDTLERLRASEGRFAYPLQRPSPTTASEAATAFLLALAEQEPSITPVDQNPPVC